MSWDTPLVSWGQLSWLCPISATSAHPSSLLLGLSERQKNHQPCASIAQRYQKHSCVINTVSSPDAKHCPMLARRRKIIPAKSSSFCIAYSLKKVSIFWFVSHLLFVYSWNVFPHMLFPWRTASFSWLVLSSQSLFFLESVLACLIVFVFIWTCSYRSTPQTLLKGNQGPASL